MKLIDVLRSQDYATLKGYFFGKFKEKLNVKIQSKVEAYKASLIAHNAELKAKVQAQLGS